MRGKTLRLIVWPAREWALNFMPLEFRYASTASAIRVLGEEKTKPKNNGGKRTRIRVVRKYGHP